MELNDALQLLRAFGLLARSEPGPTLIAVADSSSGADGRGVEHQFSLSILPHQDAELREQRVIVQCFERVLGEHEPSITCVFKTLGSSFPIGAARSRVVRHGWHTVAFYPENRLDRRSGASGALSECARVRLGSVKQNDHKALINVDHSALAERTHARRGRAELPHGDRAAWLPDYRMHTLLETDPLDVVTRHVATIKSFAHQSASQFPS